MFSKETLRSWKIQNSLPPLSPRSHFQARSIKTSAKCLTIITSSPVDLMFSWKPQNSNWFCGGSRVIFRMSSARICIWPIEESELVTTLFTFALFPFESEELNLLSCEDKARSAALFSRFSDPNFKLEFSHPHIFVTCMMV